MCCDVGNLGKWRDTARGGRLVIVGDVKRSRPGAIYPVSSVLEDNICDLGRRAALSRRPRPLRMHTSRVEEYNPQTTEWDGAFREGDMLNRPPTWVGKGVLWCFRLANRAVQCCCRAQLPPALEQGVGGWGKGKPSPDYSGTPRRDVKESRLVPYRIITPNHHRQISRRSTGERPRCCADRTAPSSRGPSTAQPSFQVGPESQVETNAHRRA